MAVTHSSNIDYRLLSRLSDLVICSSCLQEGKVTPVPQVISDRHTLTNTCTDCRPRMVHRAQSDATIHQWRSSISTIHR